MSHTGLGQSHFSQSREWTDNANRNILLDLSNQQAFLNLVDDGGLPKASSAVHTRYSSDGLCDANGVRRVVRVVTIPAGTRIFKLTGGLEAHETNGGIDDRARAAALMKSVVLFAFSTMSPWWTPVGSFQEDTGGIRAHFQNMVLNSIAAKGAGELTLREYVRFMSAVVLEWNRLTYYVEATLAKDVLAYWGQFEEQVATSKLAELRAGNTAAAAGAPGANAVTFEQDGTNTFIRYPNEPGKYYLPAETSAMLGGMEAWQFYIPKFERTDIVEDSVLVIPAANSGALAAHFGCPGIFEAARVMAGEYVQAQQAHARSAASAAGWGWGSTLSSLRGRLYRLMGI